jgi:16S rRNA G1207 methylase RsmC
LTTHRELCSNAASILELGAGAGLPGLVAASLSKDPSRCVLTDNNERVLELLNRNIEANFTDDKRM